MRARRERMGLPPMQYGIAAYAIVRDSEEEARREVERITTVKDAAGNANYNQWLAGTQLERKVSLEDYSVSNRGLRSGLVGTPEQLREALKLQTEQGGHLGAILKRMGACDGRAIAEALLEQVRVTRDKGRYLRHTSTGARPWHRAVRNPSPETGRRACNRRCA